MEALCTQPLFAKLAVPPVFLEQLRLTPGSAVGVAMTDNGQLLIVPRSRPRYTLDELLDASDYSQPQPREEREWVDAPATGGELI